MSSALLRCVARATAAAAALFAAAFYDNLGEVEQGQLVIVLVALGCTLLAMEHQGALARERDEKVVSLDRKSAQELVDDLPGVVGIDDHRSRRGR